MWDSQKLQEPADDYRQDVFRRFAATSGGLFQRRFRPLCDVVVGQVRGFLNFVFYLEHMLVFDIFFY